MVSAASDALTLSI